MIRKQCILVLLAFLLAACGPVAAVTTASPTARPITPAPPLPTAKPTTPEALPSATPTQLPVRTVTDLGTDARSISFSDKEPWLAVLIDPFTDGQAVVILDYITGARLRTINRVADTGSEGPDVFRPGSTEFVTESSSGAVTLWDAATGQALGNFPGPEKDWASSFAFTADGKTLAAGFYKEVRIWDVASRQLLETITPDIPPLRINSLAFSPDGQTLAFGTESGVLIVWDVGKKQSKVIGYERVGSMAFSPDGRWLATAALGSPAVLWDTTRWTKQVVLADAVNRGAEGQLAFAPGGKSLAVSSGGNIIQVWDTARLVKTHELAAQAGSIQSLAFARDGHTLAAALLNQSMKIWDLREAGAVEAGGPAPTVIPDDLMYTFPRPLQPGSPPAIGRVQMFDERSGWGFAPDGPSRTVETNNHLLHTVDGGQTWKEDALPGGVEPGDFFALDANTAWTAPAFHYNVDANSVIIPYTSLSTWRTTDGGKTWQQSQPFSLETKWGKGGVSDYSVEMQFLDRNNGWMLVNIECSTARLCQWQLYRTGDGGMHWQRASESDPYNPAPNQPLLFSTAFWDGRNGWGAGSVIGFAGGSATWSTSLSTTSDGSRTWDTLPIPPPGNLPADFQNGQIDCGAMRVQRISKDAAAVWTECMIYNNDSYPRYWFYHLTPDRGKTWHAWPTNNTEDFISGTTGWRLELPGAGQLTKILQTTDSGATWTVVSSVPWQASLDFISDQVGWAVAGQQEARALLKTTDGGKTWVQVPAVLR